MFQASILMVLYSTDKDLVRLPILLKIRIRVNFNRIPLLGVHQQMIMKSTVYFRIEIGIITLFHEVIVSPDFRTYPYNIGNSSGIPAC